MPLDNIRSACRFIRVTDTLPPGLGRSLVASLGRRGVTQAEIGAVLGISQAAVSRRVNGQVDFRTSEVDALREAFSISTEALLSGEKAAS